MNGSINDIFSTVKWNNYKKNKHLNNNLFSARFNPTIKVERLGYDKESLYEMCTTKKDIIQLQCPVIYAQR